MATNNNFNTKTTEETTNTWLTPPWLIKKLGEFDLDPCAAPEGRFTDCAKDNYTEADDGLSKPWYGRVWLNPPYGKEAAPFMQRMSEHRRGIALVFARTDTRWFHDTVFNSALYMFFFKGRIRFYKLDGTIGQTPNAASCLVAWDESELPVLEHLQAEGFGVITKIIQHHGNNSNRAES